MTEPRPIHTPNLVAPKRTIIANRGIALLVVAAVLLIALAFVSLIAYRTYRGAHLLIDARPPSPLFEKSPNSIVDDMQSVLIESHGLRLAGWYVPSKNQAAVVIVHGVVADRATMLTEIRLLAAAGYGVLAFDWPGLGQSEGAIFWGAQAREALVSAIDWITIQHNIDARRIGCIGFSMGGFVLTQVAAKDQRCRAVVIESAASDFDAYIKVNNGKWGFFSEWVAHLALRNSGLFSAEDTALRRIGEISPRPVLIIGESGDKNVPEAMLRSLDAAARPPKSLWIINGSQHGHYEQAAGVEYGRRLQSFFNEYLLGREHE